MKTVIIPVSTLEFVEGGHTIWVHDKKGGTTLRIKTYGKITTKACTDAPLSHCDIMVEKDIHFCLADNAKKV